MSQSVDLEFIRTKRWPWFGFAFLLLALVIGTAVFYEWNSLRVENERRNEQIGRMESAIRQRQTELAAESKKRNGQSEGRIKAYGAVSAALNYPWNQVFGEIEEAISKDIALLSMVHDQAGATHIVVETLELPAMTQFVERLNGDETGLWYIAGYQFQSQNMPPTIRGEITRK